MSMTEKTLGQIAFESNYPNLSGDRIGWNSPDFKSSWKEAWEKSTQAVRAHVLKSEPVKNVANGLKEMLEVIKHPQIEEGDMSKICFAIKSLTSYEESAK
jgi:hypothetical protein